MTFRILLQEENAPFSICSSALFENTNKQSIFQAWAIQLLLRKSSKRHRFRTESSSTWDIKQMQTASYS
eukprot:scaffold11103_cov117-Cylindrotheca_fusiformis.AAC.4